VNPLDRLRAFGNRFAFVRNVGTSDAETHWHHALVCSSAAALGALAAIPFPVALVSVAQPAWLACWLAYVLREVAQWRGQRWAWDAFGDVGVPLCWGIVGLSGDTRQLLVWLAVSAVLGCYYTAWRPAPPKPFQWDVKDE
jgi:hypothetical protein